jgi:hypothetical protein
MTVEMTTLHVGECVEFAESVEPARTPATLIILFATVLG